MDTNDVKKAEPASAEEVLLCLNKVFPIIKRLYGVRKIGIFGSFARRENEDNRRIELLVEFSKGFETYRLYLDLMKYLCEQLGSPVHLVTSRAYQEGELEDREKSREFTLPAEPLPALIADFEMLVGKCEGLSVEAFSRNIALRDFAETCFETAAMISGEIGPAVKRSGPKVPWDEIEAIGADIASSMYPADPHLIWNYIHSDIPVILGDLRKLAGA